MLIKKAPSLSWLMLLAFAAQLLFSTSVSAEIYSYTDDEGRTHYVDAPQKIPEQYRDGESKPADLPSLSKVPARDISTSTSSPSKTVEIFVADWCPHCRRLEEFLKNNKIAYKRWDIEKSERAKIKYKKLGGGGIPIVKIGSRVLRGFMPNTILAELDKD